MSYNYLFGPVPSRRLGRSLGVDLIPFKTCTMNCRFCQLGNSERALRERLEYVPMAEVLGELDRWLKMDGQADHITLAGSGEPTLHTGFGDVLRWVKENADIPSVLLSNGSLFHLSEVRAAAAWANKVKVTLSAWGEASFQQIHQPARGVTFKQLIEGERAFRNDFSGELAVEVFVVGGMNSEPSQIQKIAELIETIHPDRIDLNTAVRPPADSGVMAVSKETLEELAKLLGPKAKVTASFKKKVTLPQDVSEETLLSLIRRHPATVEQLARDFNASHESVFASLEALVSNKHLFIEQRAGERYYFSRE